MKKFEVGEVYYEERFIGGLKYYKSFKIISRTNKKITTQLLDSYNEEYTSIIKTDSEGNEYIQRKTFDCYAMPTLLYA